MGIHRQRVEPTRKQSSLVLSINLQLFHSVQQSETYDWKEMPSCIRIEHARLRGRECTGYTFSMNHVVITLKEADLMALWSALIDEDGADALAFLKERVLPQIPRAGTAPCDSTRLNPYLPKEREAGS
jgi:hypothetical protein